MPEPRILNGKIANCRKCPRLIEYIAEVARNKRAAYSNCDYWGKPVPNFGCEDAELLIIGLAPAAHGANRTGRMFTGDRSGDWLFRSLHKAGFANQAASTEVGDGLELSKCLITAVAHCAPPGNKPDRAELDRCRGWLLETLRAFRGRAFLALGGIAWKETQACLAQVGMLNRKNLPFGHGVFHALDDGKAIFASYHPSQQNTFTGRLTEPMFDSVFEKINAFLNETPRPEPHSPRG